MKISVHASMVDGVAEVSVCNASYGEDEGIYTLCQGSAEVVDHGSKSLRVAAETAMEARRARLNKLIAEHEAEIAQISDALVLAGLVDKTD